ncbi:MAG: sigma-70 family RNA polymerase sigma factor, partial [Bacteroidales bacterium]|nr:sigma-70 family RNA polymerase sigma factor [Bacteroidales bacterium]
YYLKAPDDSREIVADVFVALWQTRKILDKVQDPDAYLFIALKHARSKYIGKKYKERPELLTDELPDTFSASLSDSSLLDNEMSEKYQHALSKLPPRCAEVFRLVRREKKKYSEAAEILGISVKTVDNQMNKAVKILYAELKEHLFSIFF